MILNFKNLSLSIDYEKGFLSSLKTGGVERLVAPSPLFKVRLRDAEGNAVITDSTEAKLCTPTADGAIYGDFSSADISVRASITDENGEAAWRISVTPNDSNYFVEWVDFPSVILPALEKNNTEGNGGRILYPYNEGVIISDISSREESFIHYEDPEYPSKGSFGIFPNMVCSQMIAYLWENTGLYIGAHDPQRAVKDINIVKVEKGVMLKIRLFCGTDFGQKFETDYPIVFSAIDGTWESAAERYRAWFESSLPNKVKKIIENPDLPEWYKDSPLVVSYPVRGTHDMDEMTPNKLYPYTNALPILDSIKKACDARLLVLLMHWEGTAPWAPPYVWPPYGDKTSFDEFLHKLHERGDMLGVYCSGFGYTMQSNLIAEYNKESEYKERGLERGMCAGPDGKVSISNICTGQRSGYDICPASPVGRALLDEAYEPLLKSELDYVQILDQNHGGGQYFCYGKDHGHPPAPGAWMTKNMQNMLSDWNDTAGKMLLGCESAASEAFIGNLLFSDNRFELNYFLGTPVPMYAYIYHEYVRNFMGNQVCCPLNMNEESLRYRIAYSFSAGDCMTLVLTQDGDLMDQWGMKDFSCLPNKDKALRLIANLTKFYKEEASKYLYAGRMIESPEIECDCVTFGRWDAKRSTTLPAILHSSWEATDGSRALILVNPSECEAICKVDGSAVTIHAMSAKKISL